MLIACQFEYSMKTKVKVKVGQWDDQGGKGLAYKPDGLSLVPEDHKSGEGTGSLRLSSNLGACAVACVHVYTINKIMQIKEQL